MERNLLGTIRNSQERLIKKIVFVTEIGGAERKQGKGGQMKRILACTLLLGVMLLALGCQKVAQEEVTKVVTSEVTRQVTREVTRIVPAIGVAPTQKSATTPLPTTTPQVVEKQVTVLVLITTTPAPTTAPVLVLPTIYICPCETVAPPTPSVTQMRVEIIRLPADRLVCCRYAFFNATGKRLAEYPVTGATQVLTVPREAQTLRLEGSADGRCPWSEYTTVIGKTDANRIPLRALVVLEFVPIRTPTPWS
jgi:hypothetical protein